MVDVVIFEYEVSLIIESATISEKSNLNHNSPEKTLGEANDSTGPRTLKNHLPGYFSL